MGKAHKSPESPKAIKKLECLAHQVPRNIQNITPTMPTINTPLLYGKDNLDDTVVIYVLTIGFFMKRSFFK